MIKHIILISFVFLSSSKTKVESQNIEDKIEGYFKSSYLDKFYESWHKSRPGFENALARYVKESYSATGTINVYVKQEDNLQELCPGFLVNDNIVVVLLKELYLREIPQLLQPDISVSLAHNVIRFETKLPKMFLDADYHLFRNRSDIIYNGNHDPSKNSPFALQQVQPQGKITIIAEDCHVTGLAVVTLTGVTPHIGAIAPSVRLCKFNIEIYQPGLPSPPVIAPYFSKDQRKELQTLMVKPISSDLTAKLQGGVVSLINTTAVFGPDTMEFRWAQKQIFTETRNYLHNLVRRMNKAIIRANQGVIQLPDLEIMWDDDLALDRNHDDRDFIKITEVTVNGLDLAYASLRGGPIRMMIPTIVEELRFYRLQIRGRMQFENGTYKSALDFGAELLDVPVSIEIKLNSMPQGKKDAPRKQLSEFKVHIWRDINILSGILQKPVDTVVISYLVKEVPPAISNRLKTVLQKVLNEDEDMKNELDS